MSERDRRLTPFEVAIAASDRRSWQPVLHLEVTLEGAVDLDRLRAAVAVAMARHRLARSVLTGGWRPSWREIDAGAAAAVVVSAADAVDVARRRLLAARWDLRRDVAWRLVVAPAADTTTLVLVAHHALFDGRGALALLTAAARAYAGDHDETRGRDVPFRAGGGGGRVGPVDHLTAGAGDGSGQDVVLEALDEASSAAVFAAGGEHATVNDVLLAATHLACAHWNECHDGGHAGRIGVTVPVETWPAHVPRLVVNRTLQAATVSAPHDRADRTNLLDSISAQTRHAKEGGAGESVAVVGRAPLPLGVVHAAFRAAAALAGDRVLLTTRLSNIGRVDEAPFAAAGLPVRHLWFSPPARAPQPLTLGAATVRRRLHLAVRRDGGAVDADGARQFLALVVGALADLVT